MSAWGGGNPGGGPGQGQGAAGFGGGYKQPQPPQGGGYQPFGGGGAQYNPPPPQESSLGQVNPAAAGVGGSTGGGGGVLSVPQTSFGMGGGGMQRPNGDAQQNNMQPNGNFGRPQPMRPPMMQGGMGMQRPPMQSMQQQSMQRPMGHPPSSILARMRNGGGGGQMGPPSTGGPMPGMSNTRMAPPPGGVPPMPMAPGTMQQQGLQSMQQQMPNVQPGGPQVPQAQGAARWAPDEGSNFRSVANPNQTPMPQGLTPDQQSNWQQNNPAQIRQYAPATFPGQ